MKRKTLSKVVFWGIIACFLGTMGILEAAKTGNYAVTQGGRTYYNIYDEDAMGSDDSVGLATQQSIKAYVDMGTVYTHATSNAVSGSSAYTWSFDDGNTLMISGASVFALTLPAITEAKKGYTLLVKNTADAVVRTIYANYTGVTGVTDYIETFRGDSQTTSTSDTTIDQVGEWRMWELDMDSSGTTGYWRLIGDGAIGNSISLTKDSGTSTFTLTETIALSGHVFLLPTATCGTGGPLDAVGANGMASGVTTVLPTPTAAMDGREMTFVNSSGSGVSPFFLYVDGVATFGYASGTTSGVATTFNGSYEVIPDAQGDAITVVADYNSAVSYWVKSFNFR